MKQLISKQKVRFLTVVWGPRYIREFVSVSLPSFLAPGNMPALACTSELECVILTTEASRADFEREPSFHRLCEVAKVSFIYIDDLIASGAYGVTLTLAYARGIMDAGAAQTETWFVFMNSDFVLADGSLGALAERLTDKPGAIMSASLRANAEAALPLLEARLSADRPELVLPSRDAVRIALDHPHRTVISRTATLPSIYNTSFTQVYWRVDEDTLLSRNFLIFMLAIRPQVPMPLVSSYSDYGFVPSLVPDGPIDVIDDSDTFFMLELQPEQQEAEMLKIGSTTPEAIAQGLQEWTTAEHRFCGTKDVVFHAADLPDKLVDARREIDHYVARITTHLTKPKEDKFHRYWLQGVAFWQTYRGGGPGRDAPPELATEEQPSQREGVLGTVLSRIVPKRFRPKGSVRVGGLLRQWIIPSPPYPIWTAGYSARALLKICARANLGAKPCVVWNEADAADGITRRWVEVFSKRCGAETSTWGAVTPQKTQEYSSFIYVSNKTHTANAVQNIADLIAATTTATNCFLFVDQTHTKFGAEPPQKMIADIMINCDPSPISAGTKMELHSAGYSRDIWLTSLQKRAARALVVDSPLALFRSPMHLLGAVLATLTLMLQNLLASNRTSDGQYLALAVLIEVSKQADTPCRHASQQTHDR